MKTSRIASGALAVALAFGVAACDAEGTTASDDVDSVDDTSTLDTGTAPDDGLGETTTDTGTTGTDG